jgi:hypothetical protein
MSAIDTDELARRLVEARMLAAAACGSHDRVMPRALEPLLIAAVQYEDSIGSEGEPLTALAIAAIEFARAL